MVARLDQLADLDLVGSRGGGGKGERHIAKAEFEQSIAAPRLAIIVALRGRPAQYLDLAIVEPEAFVDARNLRFRSEGHTSELQSLMRTSYAVLCLKKQIRARDTRRTR